MRPKVTAKAYGKFPYLVLRTETYIDGSTFYRLLRETFDGCENTVMAFWITPTGHRLQGRKTRI